MLTPKGLNASCIVSNIPAAFFCVLGSALYVLMKNIMGFGVSFGCIYLFIVYFNLNC